MVLVLRFALTLLQLFYSYYERYICFIYPVPSAVSAYDYCSFFALYLPIMR